MIDIDAYGREYVEQYRHGEFETVIASIRRRTLLGCVERYPHRRMLEVGCGFEPLFTSIPSFDEYWAAEPMGEAVTNARRLAGADTRVHVVEGFFEQVETKLPAEFDFIAVSSLLHEVSDPAALLGSVRRHCGTATVAHFNVPNVRSFHRLLALEAGLISDVFEKSAIEERFQRQTRFDRDALVGLVERNGFEVLEWSTYFVKPFTHAQMEQMLKHGIIDMRVVDALDRMTRYMPELGCEMYVNVRRAE